MGIKTAFRNGKYRAKAFYLRHKTGCKIAIGVTATALTCGAGYLLMRHKHSDDVPEIEAPALLPDTEVRGLEISHDEPENYKNEWKEDYRETYDKVQDFAQSIDLVDHEMYIIERNSDYDEYRQAHDMPTNIVSHIVDNWGVYPPEENNELEVKEE